MPWEKNGTPNTLASAGDILTVDDLTAENTSLLLCHALNSGTISTNITFDNDTGSNYAIRVNFDGEEAFVANQSNIATGGDAADGFHVYYTVNVRDQEKLLLGDKVDLSSTGVGNVPSRREQTGKWTNTTDLFTRVDFTNAGSGSFVANSNLSVLSDVVPIPETIGGWVELGRTTLSSASDIITVSGLSDKRYYQFLVNNIPAGQAGTNLRLGAGSVDTGSNYSYRFSPNGQADAALANQTDIELRVVFAGDNHLDLGYISNLPSEEKLGQSWTVNANTAGAGNAPQRQENTFKWVNTSDSLGTISVNNDGSGSFNTGSEVVVLGWDPADTHTNNFWEELASVTLGSSASTITTGVVTPKKYNWVQMYCPGYTSGNQGFRLGSTTIDSSTNYSERRSKNGAADGTSTGLTGIRAQDDTGDDFFYVNLFFVNNASDEKLVIGHTVASVTGVGNAPNRLQFVGKWDNTSNQADILEFFSFVGTMDADTTLRWWGAN